MTSASSHNGKTGSLFTILLSITGKLDTVYETVFRHWTTDKPDLWSLREWKQTGQALWLPWLYALRHNSDCGEGGGVLSRVLRTGWVEVRRQKCYLLTAFGEVGICRKRTPQICTGVPQSLCWKQRHACREWISMKQAKTQQWAMSWPVPRAHTGLWLIWFQPELSLVTQQSLGIFNKDHLSLSMKGYT